MITLIEYNRRFELIMWAYQIGYFSAYEASQAMNELSNQKIKR